MLVASDHFVKGKLGCNTTVLLTEAQRERLWNEELMTGGGDGAVDWTWVLRENDWPRIVDNLDMLFEADGLDVEFVRRM